MWLHRTDAQCRTPHVWGVMALSLAALLSACAPVPKEVKEAKEFVRPVFPPPPDEARFYWERAIHSSADVVPDDADAAMRRRLTGEVRTGQGLDKPYGVAVHKGKVFVGDTVARNVAVFDLNAGTFNRIGVEEPGALASPFGLEVDQSGRLYVLDGRLKRIHLYDENGKFVKIVASDHTWSRPVGLALDEAGRRIYMVDNGGVDKTVEHRVVVLDLDTGKELFKFGKRGSGPGEFNLPRDIALGKDGKLYVVDAANFRVQVFDSQGKFIKHFGDIGLQSGQFSRPKEITVGPDGNLYIVDSGFGNFQIFNPDGQVLLNVGGRGGSDAPARFMLPSGIAADVDGRVYMVDQFFRKVEVFRPAAVPEKAPYGAAIGG